MIKSTEIQQYGVGLGSHADIFSGAAARAF